jgi:predicted transcriptional regulator
MEEEKRKSARRKEWVVVFNSFAKKANVPLASYNKILRFEQYPICTILGLLNE